MNRKECRQRTINRYRQRLLPKEVIFAAIRGEEKALNKVIHHYERYIDRLASQELYDNYGNIYIYRDPVLKIELQNKLVAGILKFRISG